MGPPRRPQLERLSGYRNHFGSTGNPALPFRVAFRAFLVQARLRLTDEETVEQIRENPYIQYFLGFEGYRSEKKPFDPSMMVYFRRRLDAETLKALDLRIFERRREMDEGAKKADESGKNEAGVSSVPGSESAPVDGREAGRSSASHSRNSSPALRETWVPLGIRRYDALQSGTKAWHKKPPG